MKKIIFVLVAAAAASPAAAVDWKEHPNDKIAHVALGGALSFGVSQYFDRPPAGIAAATAVGVLKESTDRHFDTGDLASWVVGGLVGAAISKNIVITPRGFAWRKDF